MPALRHEDVRDELLGGLSDAGRRQLDRFGAVYESRQVASHLAELRATTGLSQREVAKRAGVDQADLSRIESAQVIPSLPTLLRLLDVVGGTLVVARKRAPHRPSARVRTTRTEKTNGMTGTQPTKSPAKPLTADKRSA